MLNKDICIKCKNGKINNKNRFKNEAFDFAFNNIGFVICPYVENNRECILMTDDNPPEECPYTLEHTVKKRKWWNRLFRYKPINETKLRKHRIRHVKNELKKAYKLCRKQVITGFSNTYDKQHTFIVDLEESKLHPNGLLAVLKCVLKDLNGTIQLSEQSAKTKRFTVSITDED
jgi:hypothetical protein